MRRRHTETDTQASPASEQLEFLTFKDFGKSPDEYIDYLQSLFPDNGARQLIRLMYQSSVDLVMLPALAYDYYHNGKTSFAFFPGFKQIVDLDAQQPYPDKLQKYIKSFFPPKSNGSVDDGEYTLTMSPRKSAPLIILINQLERKLRKRQDQKIEQVLDVMFSNSNSLRHRISEVASVLLGRFSIRMEQLKKYGLHTIFQDRYTWTEQSYSDYERKFRQKALRDPEMREHFSFGFKKYYDLLADIKNDISKDNHFNIPHLSITTGRLTELFYIFGLPTLLVNEIKVASSQKFVRQVT